MCFIHLGYYISINILLVRFDAALYATVTSVLMLQLYIVNIVVVKNVNKTLSCHKSS